MMWRWSWAWTPHIRAHFGENPIADWMRVGIVAGGMILVMLIIRTLLEQHRRNDIMEWDQMARFVILLLAVVSIVLTEAAVFGTVATPRLLVDMVVVVAGTIAVQAKRTRQKNQPVIREKIVLRSIDGGRHRKVS